MWDRCQLQWNLRITATLGELNCGRYKGVGSTVDLYKHHDMKLHVQDHSHNSYM